MLVDIFFDYFLALNIGSYSSFLILSCMAFRSDINHSVQFVSCCWWKNGSKPGWEYIFLWEFPWFLSVAHNSDWSEIFRKSCRFSCFIHTFPYQDDGQFQVRSSMGYWRCEVEVRSWKSRIASVQGGRIPMVSTCGCHHASYQPGRLSKH